MRIHGRRHGGVSDARSPLRQDRAQILTELITCGLWVIQIHQSQSQRQTGRMGVRGLGKLALSHVDGLTRPVPKASLLYACGHIQILAFLGSSPPQSVARLLVPGHAIIPLARSIEDLGAQGARSRRTTAAQPGRTGFSSTPERDSPRSEASRRSAIPFAYPTPGVT